MGVHQRRRLLALWAAASFVIITVYLASCQPKWVIDPVWARIREPVLWALGYTRYDFRPTADEARCYSGTISRHNADNVTAEIPRTVHFVWGPRGDGAFTFTLYLAIRAALVTLRPSEVRVHYTHLDRSNRWFRLLEPNVTLVHHDPRAYLGPFLDLDPESWDVAHMADVLRLTVLAEEGGTYLDADAFALRPLDRLLLGNRDVVMGHEGGNRRGLTNAVILSKRGAPFVRRWLSMYDSFDATQWSRHSVALPRELEALHPDELCAVSPSAFFWPMWTDGAVDWMHGPLTPAEAREVEATVRRNGGSLFADQLVLHAWSHAAKKYLARLTPEVMRAEDTRFNIVMRRFLED